MLQVQLQGGAFDLVISPLPLNHANLEVEGLFREPLLVVAAQDHPIVSSHGANGTIRRADLVRQNVLAIERGHLLHEQVRAICEDFGARLLHDYEGTSLDTLRQMVGMGVGLAFLPALYVRSEIGDRGEVAVLKLRDCDLHRQIGMTWRKRSVQAQRFRDIAELVRTLVSQTMPEVSVMR